MSWQIVMIQSGGCNYTIGCGLAFVNLGCETLEEAIEEAKKFFLDDENIDYLDPNSERFLKNAYLIQYDNDTLPLAEWRFEAQKLKAEQIKKREEAKELAELERLKRKYGK